MAQMSEAIIRPNPNIWYEDEKQLGFAVTLPDGREFSVDIRYDPINGLERDLMSAYVLRIGHDGRPKRGLKDKE